MVLSLGEMIRLVKPVAIAELIKRTSASQQRRVQILLNEVDLGDGKPTRLLRHMRQLLGEQRIDEGIFKQLFLQRLPPTSRLS